jgi:hypothetical protein
LRIYDPAGDLVYSSRRRGDVVPTGGGRPLFIWNTRNNSGRLTGSGLFTFIFSDGSDKKVLARGKLVIVR